MIRPVLDRVLPSHFANEDLRNHWASLGTMATLAEAAFHIDLNERRFRELVEEGIIPRAERGSYDLDTVRVTYIRHQRAIASGRASQGALDPPQERARKDKELADRTALQNAVTRAELFSGSVVTRLVVEAFTNVRTKLLALPTKLAPIVIHLETIPEAQAVINDGVNEALAELSAGAVLAAAGAQTLGSIGAEPAGDGDAPRGEPEQKRRARQPDVRRRAVSLPS